MAASSVEQTPDPGATLAELRRVLRPGGRIRIMYEDLDRYRGGRENEVIVEAMGDGESRIVFYVRDTGSETASMFSLSISLSRGEILGLLGRAGEQILFDAVEEDHMETIRPYVIAARACRLTHPSGTSFKDLLREAGFSRVMPTRCGIDVARNLFDNTPEKDRPDGLAGLDRLLRPLVEKAVLTPAPLVGNPPITAVR
jgi:hypothetical protein